MTLGICCVGQHNNCKKQTLTDKLSCHSRVRLLALNSRWWSKKILSSSHWHQKKSTYRTENYLKTSRTGFLQLWIWRKSHIEMGRMGRDLSLVTHLCPTLHLAVSLVGGISQPPRSPMQSKGIWVPAWDICIWKPVESQRAIENHSCALFWVSEQRQQFEKCLGHTWRWYID